MRMFDPSRTDAYLDVELGEPGICKSRASDMRKTKMAFGMLLILLLALAISYELNKAAWIGSARRAQSTAILERALDGLGKKYVAQQDYLEAIIAFEALLETNPKSRRAEEALCTVGLCWLCLDDADRAIETWERFLRLYPDSKYAAKVWESYLILMKERSRGVPV